MRWLCWVALLWIGIGSSAMAIEEPTYELLKKEGDFEIRRYAPLLIAEVEVTGDRSEASNRGFRLVADFIFGNNAGKGQESEKIAMTAPVTISLMTGDATKKMWRLHFVMPKEFTLESLPKPKNEAVRIKNVPTKIYAVYVYSGLNGDEKIDRFEKKLQDWVSSRNLRSVAPPQLARYNPPWTLPPFRRNEILLEISNATSFD